MTELASPKAAKSAKEDMIEALRFVPLRPLRPLREANARAATSFRPVPPRATLRAVLI